jgi:glycosyltransferase involved in cell wall biosynthesis
MKIGFVTAFPPEKDGVADYSFYLIESILKVSNDCSFYVMSRLLDDKPSVTRFNERVLLFRIWRMKSFKDMLRSLMLLFKTIVAMKMDILHFQYRFTRDAGGSVGEPLYILMLFTRKIMRKTKIVISLHDFWLPEEVEQRAYEVTRSRLASKLYRLYYSAYLRAILSVPHLIISIVNYPNSPVTKFIRRYTKKEVVEVIHGLPDIKATKKSGEAFSMGKSFTALLFGFIRRSKGYQYVIRALAKIVTSNPSIRGKVKLLIAGIPAPSTEWLYFKYLVELIRKLGIGDIVSIVTKYLDTQEVDALFRSVNVVIVPYMRRVGPSGILSFALAYEVPTIITSDSKYIITDSDFPAMIVKLNENEIGYAILKLMNDKNEYEKQIQRIRRYKKMHNNEKIALRHVELYRKLLSGEYA